jgi:hypothetical protein
MHKTAWKYTKHKANSHHFSHQNCLVEQSIAACTHAYRSSHVEQAPITKTRSGGFLELWRGQNRSKINNLEVEKSAMFTELRSQRDT